MVITFIHETLKSEHCVVPTTMLRRTTQSLMLRRTAIRRSGEERPHPLFNCQGPDVNETYGLFGKLNGSLAILRVIDPKWILNRLVNLGRDGYVGFWVFAPFLWSIYWVVPQKALWGDGKPPRKVDWNKEEAGRLPKGFTPTSI